MNRVEIVNYALTRLGGRRIANLESENSEEAKAMNLLFEDTVREVLQLHPWPDAIKRSTVAEVSGGADYTDREYRYQLPLDLVWLMDILDSTTYYPIRNLLTSESPGPNRKTVWDREGSTILCDISPCFIKYVYYPIDMNVFSVTLARAMGVKLAHAAAMRLGRDPQVQGALFQEASIAITLAKAASGLDGQGQFHETKTWGDYR